MAAAAWLAVSLLAGSAGARGGGAQTVHFSFSQVGVPKEEVVGHVTVRSVTRGSGTVTVEGPLNPGPVGFRTLFGTLGPGTPFIHADRIAERGGTRSVRIVLQPSEPALTLFADGSRQLNFDVRVTRSTDPACHAGSRGEFELEDNRGYPDVVYLDFCGLRHEHEYENRVRGHVGVTISF